MDTPQPSPQFVDFPIALPESIPVRMTTANSVWLFTASAYCRLPKSEAESHWTPASVDDQTFTGNWVSIRSASWAHTPGLPNEWFVRATPSHRDISSLGISTGIIQESDIAFPALA